MNTYSLYLLMAALGGAVLPLQALINARLGSVLGGPVWAATVSFVVGSLGLAAFQLLRSAPLPATSALTAPWWVWTGGLLGAYYVAAAVITVPTLGAANLMTLLILGQLTASTVLDQFGVLSDQVRPFSLQRGVGMLLLFAGALLVVRS
jgi:transporter family-2 protein